MLVVERLNLVIGTNRHIKYKMTLYYSIKYRYPNQSVIRIRYPLTMKHITEVSLIAVEYFCLIWTSNVWMIEVGKNCLHKYH